MAAEAARKEALEKAEQIEAEAKKQISEVNRLTMNLLDDKCSTAIIEFLGQAFKILRSRSDSATWIN